jgi:hypothetical protein
MKKHFLVIFLIISFLLVFSFVSGCNKNEQSLAKTFVEEKKEVISNVSESSESFKDEEINSSNSNQESVTLEDETPIATIPESWPDIIPINPDIIITISHVGETEGKYVASVDGTYSGEADDIYNYYKQEFSSLDIKEYVQEWDNGSVKNTIQTSKDGYDIAVSVTTSESGVDVSLWVKKQ